MGGPLRMMIGPQINFSPSIRPGKNGLEPLTREGEFASTEAQSQNLTLNRGIELTGGIICERVGELPKSREQRRGFDEDRGFYRGMSEVRHGDG